LSALVGTLATFLLLCVVVVPLHELGHALAAHVMGYRVLELALGSGRTLASGRVRGVSIRLHLLPVMGITRVAPRSGLRWLRLRYWIIIAGGPLAQVLLHLVLRGICGPGLLFRPGAGTLPLLMEANLVLLLFNLLPLKIEGELASDGYQLLTVPFWKPARELAHRLTALLFEASHEMSGGNEAAAHALLEGARAEHGEHPAFALAEGLVLYRERRLVQARDVWRAGLHRAVEQRDLLVLGNGVAFLDALLGGEENLREAERLSGEAVAASQNPAFLNTRGAVLVRLGRAREGLALLGKSALALIPQEQAYVGALRALGLLQLGRRAEALAELDRAREIDPRCELFPEVEIAALDPAPPLPERPADGAEPGQLAIDRARFVRSWRRQVMFLAIGTFVAFTQLGTMPWAAFTPLLLIAILLFHPHRGTVGALAASLFTLTVQQAVGLDRIRGHVSLSLAMLLVVSLLGAAAAWLAWRGPAPASGRGSAVTGTVLALWSLPSLAMISLAPQAIGYLASLVALATLLLLARPREMKALALLPLALAAVLTVKMATTAPQPEQPPIEAER